MSLGLDLGASGFRSLAKDGDRLVGRQSPACYLAVPDEPAQRRLLENAQAAIGTSDDALLVLGDDARELSKPLNALVLPVLPGGRLSEEDPIARQIAAALLERVAPASETSTPCTVVLPRDEDAPGVNDYEFFTRLLRLLNYKPTVIAGAQAVALAELGDAWLTGIAICCGAGAITACYVHQGQRLASATITTGGDWIDRQIAERMEAFVFDSEGRRYLNTTGIAAWKQGWRGSILNPQTEIEQLLARKYRAGIDLLLEELGRSLLRIGRGWLPHAPLPLVAQGGGAQVNGFRELVRARWEAAKLPITLSSVRVVQDDLWVVARGCLIHSEVESAASATNRVA